MKDKLGLPTTASSSIPQEDADAEDSPPSSQASFRRSTSTTSTTSTTQRRAKPGDAADDAAMLSIQDRSSHIMEMQQRVLTGIHSSTSARYATDPLRK